MVSAIFQGTPEEDSVIAERMEASREKRRTSQPVAASAGCIFKNPESTAAGQLVDELGFKDRAVGAARVSEVHGNFIVNEGGASAAEVLELIGRIQAAAKSQRDIDLDTEVQVMGQEEAI